MKNGCVFVLSLYIFVFTQWNVGVDAQPVAALSKCRSTLFRLIGDRNVYLWVCRCMRGSRRVALGRASLQVSAEPEGQLMRHQAFVRCQNDRFRRTLSHICLDSNRNAHYEQRANEALQHCRNAPFISDPKSLAIANPFQPARGTCFAEFVGLFSGTQTSGLWACVCKQDFVEVVVARAQFTSQAAPDGDEAREVRVLEECTKNLRQQLENVCFNAPGDFQLLALHNLQACCKRARIGSNAKFQCTAFVPKNVDSLKPESLTLV